LELSGRVTQGSRQLDNGELHIFFITKHYKCDKINKDEIDEACRTSGRDEKSIKSFDRRSFEKKNQFGGPR
jgi:hypothetical protein